MFWHWSSIKRFDRRTQCNIFTLLGKVLVDGMEKQELKLRDYQLELVKPALEGKNTIICAPTGSGKTFVAMEAIKQHVTNPDRKYVAFIVNTVSLVEQQESRLDQYLPDSVNVSSVCGSNPDISLPSVLEDTHVVVLTAQVLLNSLKKDKQATEEGVAVEKETSISQFSLLVFDECHHTTKEHPYNDIMRWYRKKKFEVWHMSVIVCLPFYLISSFICSFIISLILKAISCLINYFFNPTGTLSQSSSNYWSLGISGHWNW